MKSYVSANLYIAIILCQCCVYCLAKGTKPPNSVEMKVQNNAGAPIELFWINTFTPKRDIVKQTTTPIRNGTDTTINSYDTHEFIVKFLKDIPGVEATFKKGPIDEVINVFFEPSKGIFVTQTTRHDDLKKSIKGATTSCSAMQSDDEFSECVTATIIDKVTKISDSKEELSRYRDLLSERLRNYTCADPNMPTSTPISSSMHNIAGKNLQVDTYLDMPAAKIWTVPNFITEEECNVLMTYGKPKLRRATVAADDGSSVVSENRKAQQAGYNFGVNPESDALWPLYNRVIDLTNAYTGFSLEPPGRLNFNIDYIYYACKCYHAFLEKKGQEDFTIIQYNVDDQYTPHCDGTCDGTPHTPTGRVATAVLYCQTADVGGATTFTKSDIFINPSKGMATFFSYKGPDGNMDEGYTEHSGCPVLEGEKWITTVWMRDGVSHEHPWTMYDPSGYRLLDDA